MKATSLYLEGPSLRGIDVAAVDVACAAGRSSSPTLQKVSEYLDIRKFPGFNQSFLFLCITSF